MIIELRGERVLLDTNVLSELMKKEGNIKVQTWLDGIPAYHSDL